MLPLIQHSEDTRQINSCFNNAIELGTHNVNELNQCLHGLFIIGILVNLLHEKTTYTMTEIIEDKLHDRDGN